MCVFLRINGRNIIKYFGLILFNNSNNFSVGINKVLQMKRPYELKGNTKGWNHLFEMHYWIWTELNLIELKLWKITHSPKTWNQIQYYSALFVYQIIEVEHQWKRKSIAMVFGIHTFCTANLLWDIPLRILSLLNRKRAKTCTRTCTRFDSIMPRTGKNRFT